MRSVVVVDCGRPSGNVFVEVNAGREEEEEGRLVERGEGRLPPRKPLRQLSSFLAALCLRNEMFSLSRRRSRRCERSEGRRGWM
jgi:hypothetical protein